DTDQLAGEPQPWEFRSKPAWQRLIIMLGGVTVNFILAFVIYIGMAYAYGESYIANKDVKSGIWVQNPILEDAGLKTGDKVLKVDGKEIVKFNSLPEAILMGKDIEVERAGVVEHVQLPVDFLGQITENKGNGFIGLRIPFIVAGFGENSINEGTLMVKDIVKSINGVETPFFDMVSNVLEENKGKTVAVVVNRDGKDTTVDVKVNQEGKIETYYAPALPFDNLQKLGLYEISREQYSLAEAIPAGLHMGKDRIMSYFGQLKKIVQPETGAYKGVGGFKAIYDIFPQFWSWQVFWSITAMLSI
ncbi:RIP metalloprotease RseP, partial [Escherichia coli]